MEQLIRQISELGRQLEVAAYQIERAKEREHDLAIENQRLRDQLAYRMTQYEELSTAFNAINAKADELGRRLNTARNTIRRMEEGEL
jgi:regulator of replication initiation timing